MNHPIESEPLDHLLAQISRLHYHRAHELLNKLGLYRGQPPVLFALWKKEGLSHSELAQQLQITPTTITKMLQRMEKAGFVYSQPDEQDQRVSRVYLTEAGRRIQGDVQEVWDRLNKENFAGFSAEEEPILRQFLNRIRNNLIKITGDNVPF